MVWKHDKMDRVQIELLEKGVIEIGGDIDSDTVFYVREAFLRLIAKGNPPVKILITSDGGSVEVGLAIYDTLRSYGGEVEGVVYGYARSIASIILQACKKRKACKHARILLHHISRRQISLDVLRNSKKLDELKQEMEKSQQRLYEILVERSKKSLEEVRTVCEKNEDMTSEEALSFGLIDEIV